MSLKIISRLEAALKRMTNEKDAEVVRLRLRKALAESSTLPTLELLQAEQTVWKLCFHSRRSKTEQWLKDASSYYETIELPERRRLIRLGDLGRYSLQVKGSSTSRRRRVEQVYRRAVKLSPEDGAAYNALGVLFAADGLVISAAYWYLRAANAEKPFPAARKNMRALKARDEIGALGLQVARRHRCDARKLDEFLRRGKLGRRLLFELAIVAVHALTPRHLNTFTTVLLNASKYRPATLPALVLLSDYFRQRPPTKEVDDREQLPERRILAGLDDDNKLVKDSLDPLRLDILSTFAL